MAATKLDPRCSGDRGSWVAESLGSVLDRTPAFGRRFLISAFGEFPNLAAVTRFVRRPEQPDDVYGVINQPPGLYFQIDPDLEYLILWDHDGQADSGITTVRPSMATGATIRCPQRSATSANSSTEVA